MLLLMDNSGGKSSRDAYSGTILPQWFTDMVETEPRQGALLLGIVLLVVFVPIAGTKPNQIRQVPSKRTTLTTFVLLMTAILDMAFPGQIHCVLISMIAFGLTLFAALSMCREFPEQMHATIMMIIVLPSALISNLANNLAVPIRRTLLLPALSFTIYKATSYVLGPSYAEQHAVNDRANNRKLRKCGFVELFISASFSSILLGCSIAAVAVAMNLHKPYIFDGILNWGYGFLLASMTGIEFNFFLIVQKFMSPKSTAGIESDADLCFGTLVMFLIVVSNLICIYLCFTLCRIALFIPLIALFLLFFIVVLMVHLNRKIISNYVYFFLILVALIATVALVSLPAPLLQRPALGTQSTQPTEDPISKSERRYLKETAWLTALGCGLFCTHFMMIALFQSDTHVTLARDAAVRRSQEGQQMLPVSSAHPKSIATPPAATSKGCAEKLIDAETATPTPEQADEDIVDRNSKYTTLNMPD